MEPEDLTLIGHTGNLLVDIYTAKYGAYLHFTVLLNDGGKGAQSRRNGCSICAVEVRNLARNTHYVVLGKRQKFKESRIGVNSHRCKQQI